MRRGARPAPGILLACAGLVGCGVSEPMSKRLEVVPIVEGIHATCREVLAAMKAGEPARAAKAATADYTEVEGGPGEPVTILADAGGATVVEWSGAGPDCLVAGLERRLRRYQRVEGGLWKVRKLGAWSATEVEGRCEQRVWGILVDGTREEEVRVIDARFRREGDAWKVARCVERSRAAIRAPKPLFADDTARSGVTHVYAVPPASDDSALYPGEHQGGGVAAVDVDGDRDVDLVLMGRDGPHLWLNRGDGTFADATAASGLGRLAGGDGRGLVCADFDGDGHRDLLCAVHAGPNVYYRGTGPGRFAEATAAAGLADSGRYSTALAAGDVDGDGDLDLYVANYGDTRRHVVDFLATNGEPDRLFRNRGDGTFEDVTEAAGLGQTGFALACGFADMDGDGDPDLYVANDFAYNRLYRNLGDGTFEDVTSATGAADAGMGMGVTWADLDGDRDLDLYVSNMFSSVGQWIFEDPDYPVPGLLGWVFRGRVLDVLRKVAGGNTILRNDGAAFVDASGISGAGNGGWAWAAPALGADADGRTDLYVSAGFVTGELPVDT